MKDSDAAPDPAETVLRAVHRLTDQAPVVRLEESGREQGTTPTAGGDGPHLGLSARGRDNYELLGEIARGGMGIVLRGRDTDLGREVAVKVLDESLVGDPAVLQRFIEEAQIGGQLQHPGVVPIYELGMTTDGRPFFAMKLIRGKTLQELLGQRSSPERDRRRFLSICESVCQTVAYAHSKRVIHRDLKPANIMVGAFGEVQVVDWGLAKVLEAERDRREPTTREAALPDVATIRSGPNSQGLQSEVGSVLGTPAYMAPEQALGQIESIDERTDVFALGGILCEILTGAPPYQAGEGEHTVLLAANAELGPAHERLDQCVADNELKKLCRDCLSPSPAARPANAQAVAQRLQDYLTSLEEKAHRAELAATEAHELRRRQRLLLGLVTTVFVAVSAVGWIVRSMERQREDLRARQLASARQQMDRTADEIGGLQDGGRFDDAVRAAQQVVLEIEASDLNDPTLTERAQKMVTLAEGRAAEAHRRSQRQRRNEEFLSRGEDLRAQHIEPLVGFSPPDTVARLEEAYVEVFRNFGIELVDEDPVAALDDLLASEIGPDIGLVLDDWADLRRRLHGPDSFEAMAVTALAIDLDPDPRRIRLREALLEQDEEAVVAFLHEEDLATLHPATLWALSQGLDSLGRNEELFLVARRGATLHPDNFLLNVRVGQLYGIRGAQAAALRFLSSAVGARPESAAAYALMGEHLRTLGDLPRAAECYAEALRLEPDYDAMRNNLAWLQVVLGDYDGAERSYALLVERLPGQSVYGYKLLLVRFLLGTATKADVLERLATDEALNGREEAAAVWPLAFHPDPTQRDPHRVIAMQDSWGHEEPATEGTEAAALLQLGRPEEALATLSRGEGLGQVTVVLQAEYAVYRARAHLELGDEEQSRQFLAIADALMNQFMYDGKEPWARTPLVRLYRETLELLGD